MGTLYRILLGLLALGALGVAPGAAFAVDRHLEISAFYVYPAESPEFNKIAGFAWPDVKELNALVRVDVGGYSGEELVNLFLVVFDEDDKVLAKLKGKHILPAGEHELLFERFTSTEQFFGDRRFQAKVEASLKGAQPAQAETTFDISGPDPPDVDIYYIDIFNPQGAQHYQQFMPGDEFSVEAEFEIARNESSISPKIILYGAMEEDSYQIDPELDYQPYETQWDTLEGDEHGGIYRLRASGRLPYYFAEPYDYRHPFRIYLIVDFGSGARTLDYKRAELIDYNAGEQRSTDDVANRLIELNRSYTWEVQRVRGDRPRDSRDRRH